MISWIVAKFISVPLAASSGNAFERLLLTIIFLIIIFFARLFYYIAPINSPARHISGSALKKALNCGIVMIEIST
jgi:hypothetical protein